VRDVRVAALELEEGDPQHGTSFNEWKNVLKKKKRICPWERHGKHGHRKGRRGQRDREGLFWKKAKNSSRADKLGRGEGAFNKKRHRKVDAKPEKRGMGRRTRESLPIGVSEESYCARREREHET